MDDEGEKWGCRLCRKRHSRRLQATQVVKSRSKGWITMPRNDQEQCKKNSEGGISGWGRGAKCVWYPTRMFMIENMIETIGLLLLCAPTITFWPPASTTYPTLWILFALFLGIPRHCYSTFGMTFHNLGGLQFPGVSLSAPSASLLLSLIIHAIPCSSGAL